MREALRAVRGMCCCVLWVTVGGDLRAESVDEILAHWRENLSAIHSIDMFYCDHMRPSEYLIEKNTVPEHLREKKLINHFQGEKEKFRLEINCPGSEVPPDLRMRIVDTITAFDLEKYQIFAKRAAFLTVQEKKPTIRDLGNHPLYAPVKYLFSFSMDDISFEDLKSEAAWQGLKPRITVQDEVSKVNEKDCTIAEVDFRERNYIVKLYLSKEDGYYPVRTELIRLPGGVMTVVQEIRFKKYQTDGRPVLIPVHVKEKQSNAEGGHEVFTLELTIDEGRLSINKDVPDDVFTIPVDWSRSLVGKELGGLEEFGVKLKGGELEGKRVLVCFWDYNQRPSRHVVGQLGEMAKKLEEGNVKVVLVQAQAGDKERIAAWLKEKGIEFAAGQVEGDAEKVRGRWGVKSLPWLVLTDEKAVVAAEGIGVADLEGRIGGK